MVGFGGGGGREGVEGWGPVSGAVSRIGGAGGAGGVRTSRLARSSAKVERRWDRREATALVKAPTWLAREVTKEFTDRKGGHGCFRVIHPLVVVGPGGSGVGTLSFTVRGGTEGSLCFPG